MPNDNCVAYYGKLPKHLTCTNFVVCMPLMSPEALFILLHCHWCVSDKSLLIPRNSFLETFISSHCACVCVCAYVCQMEEIYTYRSS